MCNKRLSAVLLGSLLTFAGPTALAQDALPTKPKPKKPFLGIQMEAAQATWEDRDQAAIRITAVIPDTAADQAGLVAGDLILGVDGQRFDMEQDKVLDALLTPLRARQPGDEISLEIMHGQVDLSLTQGEKSLADPEAILGNLRGWLRGQPPGTQVEARASHQVSVRELTVTLGLRPEDAGGRPMPPNAALLGGRRLSAPFAPLLDEWSRQFDLQAGLADLGQRLSALHDQADAFRLGSVAYVHREPAAIHDLALMARDELASAAERGTAVALLATAGARLELELLPATALPDPAGHDIDAHLDWLESVITTAADHVDRAFAALNDEERQFLLDHHLELTQRFEEQIYIHTDEDRERLRHNQRTIALAARVDRAQLLAAAQVAGRILDPTYLTRLTQDLKDRGTDLTASILGRRETPLGLILLAGTGNNWQKSTDCAVIIDLGGDDLYTQNAGASVPGKIPVAVLCDLAGDDAYESTRVGTQGCGRLGVGLLMDQSGDDHYIGLRLAQGASFLGVGMLLDHHGDDTYRAHALAQGAGLFGAAVLADLSGNDRYEAHVLAQAVGMAGGTGLLADCSGDDSYYAKGTHPTGYGTMGIFEGWSQGCGVGFRTLASGGFALLHDGGGSDRMESGNFCQGGGYYFGIGVVSAAGDEDDHYLGSRYAQAFSAHQAVGAFIEDGGNDLYDTHHAVAQGLAWDESVSLFLDSAGDDRYDGGTGFSQGASAHNAVAVFWDRGGTDRYRSGQRPGSAGPNDYHDGGISLSIFIDEGGDEDDHQHPDIDGRGAQATPDHGVVADLPGSLKDALAPGTPSTPPARRHY